MKIVKRDANKECNLWEFCKNHLPESMIARKRSSDYGMYYWIEVFKRGDLSGYPIINSFFNGNIATISDDEIELRAPEYFSDFEDICRKYEKQTKKEVKLIYWES